MSRRAGTKYRVRAMSGLSSSVRRLPVRSAGLVAVLVAALASACGGATPSPKAGRTTTTYTTVDEAQRALDDAEKKLVRARGPATDALRNEKKDAAPTPTGTAPTTPTGGVVQPAPPQAQPAPPSPPTRATERPAQAEDVGKDRDGDEESGTPCELACRALASMKRAADAVCRLAGETDPRCTDARRRVSESETRVAACSCTTER